MLSVDDEGDVTVTSSCRRSCSVSYDADDTRLASLTRRHGSFMGSMTSLVPPQGRKESIVEALEKKRRESVSSRLRSHLPQHLHQSLSRSCTDLPVIVRAAGGPGSSTRRAGRVAAAEVTTRSLQSASQPLYHGVMHADTASMYCVGRPGHTRTPDRWTKSLTRYQPSSAECDQWTAGTGRSTTLDRRTSNSHCERTQADRRAAVIPAARLHSTSVFQQAARQIAPEDVDNMLNQSASSTVREPTNTGRESTWTSDVLQSAIVTTTTQNQTEEQRRVKNRSRGYDASVKQSEATSTGSAVDKPLSPHAASLERQHHTTDPGRQSPVNTNSCYAESTSSADSDTTADCDVNPDCSSSSDSCDELSVNSFTFSRPADHLQLNHSSSSSSSSSAAAALAGVLTRDEAEIGCDDGHADSDQCTTRSSLRAHVQSLTTTDAACVNGASTNSLMTDDDDDASTPSSDLAAAAAAQRATSNAQSGHCEAQQSADNCVQLRSSDQSSCESNTATRRYRTTMSISITHSLRTPSLNSLQSHFTHQQQQQQQQQPEQSSAEPSQCCIAERAPQFTNSLQSDNHQHQHAGCVLSFQPSVDNAHDDVTVGAADDRLQKSPTGATWPLKSDEFDVCVTTLHHVSPAAATTGIIIIIIGVVNTDYQPSYLLAVHRR